MMFPKSHPFRSRAYTEFVRARPCIMTGISGPNDPHHSNEPGHSTMGGKCGDERQVPLSHNLHQMLHHMGERAFWAKWGIDPEAAIAETQAAWYSVHKTRPWTTSKT